MLPSDWCRFELAEGMPISDPSLTNSAPHKHEQLQVAQSKAQELLASLEQSKKQKLQNEKLKNMCLDTEELMQKVHRHTYAARQKQDIGRLHKKADELMRDLEDGLSYTHLTKFNVEHWMRLCSLEMLVSELINPNCQPDLADCRKVRETLQNLRGLGDSAEPYTPTIDIGVVLMQRVLDLLAESKLHSKEWARVADPLLILLKDVMHAAPPEHCLVVPEEDVRRKRFEIEECSQQQAEAISEGEMKEAETLYYQKIHLQEQLSHLIKRKVTVLEEEEVQALQIPLQRVHECHNKVNMEISAILKNNDVLRNRAETDMQSLQLHMDQMAVDDLKFATAFNEEQDTSSQFLRENEQQQQECWRQIEELERQLVALGDERHHEIVRRIKALEREERRKVDHQQFVAFAERQRDLLQLTIRNCGIAEEITDTVDEFISNSCNAVERRLRELERDIEEMKLAVHQEYLSSFRGMYLTIGDLQYKKERNMEELEKKIETAHIQQEFAMETFNPKAKEFSQLKKTLQSEKKAMEEQVQSLQTKAVEYIEWFRPTEKALIEAGRDFKHPVEELNETNAVRANKLIEYHSLMTRQEDDEVEYAAELAEIERLRALTEAASVARITAPPGSVSPSRQPGSYSRLSPSSMGSSSRFR